MAYPAGWTTRSVVATYLEADGSPAEGAVDFEPTAALLDTGADDVVLPAPVRVVLSTAGMLTLSLVCTDAATVTASSPLDADAPVADWSWRVTERIKGGRTYLRTLPTGDGSTVSLFDLSPPD